MFPLIEIWYHGDVDIEYWEWSLGLIYVFALYLYFARQKNIMILKAPEYKYYLWGLNAKLAGGVIFSLIYFYYYQGGDTLAYFYSAVAMRNMAFADTGAYLDQMMGDNSLEAWSVYTLDTAKPYKYLFFDARTFAVLRMVSLVALVSFKSYLISTLVITSASFFGVWACYRTFVSYFPQLSGKLAIAFLFMPSSIFWGSAILKDTFTFSAVCWWVFAVDEVFFKRRKVVVRSVIMFLSGMMMVIIKPYIFMVLFPATLLWLLYFRVVRIRNLLIRFILVPLAGVALVAVSIFVLARMGDMFDKFALDDALETIQVTQGDLSNSTSYGSNSFDLGAFDGTWTGVISKFPIAVNAALFRPYLWEANNFTMALSALENLWVLVLAILAVLRAGPIFFLRAITGVPIILMAMFFSLLFAFTVGVTTPNFGALVRFKIPMVPFFISSLYIVNYLAQVKRGMKNRGLNFDYGSVRMGTAHLPADLHKVKTRDRAKRNKPAATAGSQQ